MLSALFSLLILAADVYAILNVVQSREETGTKVIWILVIFLLPILGFIIWYVSGPKSASG